jgi:hypothetical protein
MKSLHLFFFIFILAIFASSTTKAQHPLVGVWELESARYTTPDNTNNVSGEDWNQIKIITDSHFATIGQVPGREEFTEPGGTDAEFLAAARDYRALGGTYTLEGDTTYTEHINYMLNPSGVGASIEFSYEMEGDDRWIQRGTLPTKSLGMAEYDIELYEVWTRVE